jgi:hypothetical protein
LYKRTEQPYSCARKGNTIVVVGKGTEVLYTTDAGQNWTVITPLGGTSTSYYYSVVCDGTTFVTCRYGSNAAYTSTDGISWTARTMSQTKNWNDLLFDGTYFIAISYNTSPRPLDYSTDGINWYAGSFPDNYSYHAYAAAGGNAYIYYSYNDYKWHKTVDGGQNWTASTDLMQWFCPENEGLIPNCVSYDGSNFLCWTGNSYGYNSNFFLKSSDGFSWDWIPFTQSRYAQQEFYPGLTHYDGSDDIFLLQGYYNYYPVWFLASEGDVTKWEHRTMNTNCSIPSNQSKNKIACIPGTGVLVVGYNGVENECFWADYTEYNSSTQFQLPTLSNGLPGGLKKYIKVA